MKINKEKLLIWGISFPGLFVFLQILFMFADVTTIHQRIINIFLVFIGYGMGLLHMYGAKE